MPTLPYFMLYSLVSMAMLVRLRGYCPHSKTLPRDYRLSTFCDYAKWYSNQPISDAHNADCAWESEVRIAPGQDAPKILSKLKPLLLSHGSSQPYRWQLCSDGQGIRRSFHFKTFNKTWVRSHRQDRRHSDRRADHE